MRIERHLHVLAHAQRGEGRRNLEGAAAAQPPDGARGHAHECATHKAGSKWGWRARGWGGEVNGAGATTGPVVVSTPPSSTMTRPSVDCEMKTAEGEMVPLEKANTAPARPASAPASTKAIHWKARTSMPIASARKGESRPARSTKPKGENSTRHRKAIPRPHSASVI